MNDGQSIALDRLMDAVEHRIYIGEGTDQLAVLCAVEFNAYIIDKIEIDLEVETMMNLIARKIAEHFNQLERTKQ